MTRSQAGRPKGSKNKPKDEPASPTAAAAPAAAQQSKKRTASAAAGPSLVVPPQSAAGPAEPAAAPAAAAAVGAAPAAAPAAPPGNGSAQQSVSELEAQRQKLAKELSAVEGRIYHLETQYLENSSPFGNAIRGYEGFLGGAAAASRKVVVRAEDRLFSWSSVTGQVQRR